jgi:5-methyltetrahydrofolate--homocysteine methyltransferase
MKTFKQLLQEKVVVFDGAMGTNIQVQNLTADDFGGEHFNGCNEYLVVTKPSAIEKVHADFLSAGVDVIETDSFGSSSIVLAEYNLQDRARELSYKAAEIAKNVARQFSTPSHPRFVAGSIGPTTKLPSLGHISFKEMSRSYYEHVAGLMEGGADLLIVETCQDLLQTKSALAAIFEYFSEKRIRVPVITSVTIETMGTMLMGTEIAAALATLEPFEIDVIGMNCATGPKEMSESIRYLCSSSPLPVSCIPNAGLPENVGGQAHYHLTPEEFVQYLGHFVKDLGVSVVGGCCGTRPEHLRQLVSAVGNLSPKKREVEFIPSASSLYLSAPLHIDPPPVIVGERTNANGSKKFKDLLQAEDYDSMVNMAKDQTKEGAHVLDLCVAYVGRDEVRDMKEAAFRFNTQVTLPIMIDSTEAPVIEQALQIFAGKCIINSINMEDGEERINKIVPMCKKYGAAVVALTIDETGMAKTVHAKLAVARRMYDLSVNKFRMKPSDLIFDTLTFTLGSGDEEFRKAGIETIEGIRLIKKEFPEVKTLLGVSNISFGLAPHIRHVLNSVFLHYAIEAGLDMAIVNAQKIMPLFKIEERGRELCRQLVFDERKWDGDRCVFDPLTELMAYYADKKGDAKKEKRSLGSTVEEILKNRIIDGDKQYLQRDLDEALKRYSAIDIINNILLGGMKVVGDLFGRGEMQLPFVLQSAEVMKASVAYLEQFMEKSESSSKGSMVLATVKGDVHDIGKNLVDIILTNNGYKVYNLGIKQPIENILRAYQDYNADAIGMSGLLVKSTLVMKENLEVLNERGLRPPIVLGGAALTRRYVEQDLRGIYKGLVFYANDAFDGLHFMEQLKSKGIESFRSSAESKLTMDEESEELLTGSEAKIALMLKEKPAIETRVKKGDVELKVAAHSNVSTDVAIPTPPFWGTRIAEKISLDDVFLFVNQTALIKGQWQVRKGKKTEAEYKELLQEKIYPELTRLKKQCEVEKLLEPKVAYGYFPCRSQGNDLVIYEDDKKTERLRFTFPRQTGDRYLCLSDYFASVDSGKMDVVGFHMVTMGKKASEHSAELFASNNYKEYLYFHGLSVESAEALAELWHKKIREELGIAGKDSPDIKRLFSQGYQGSRYSFSYPACPNLEDTEKLFTLLQPERIGVTMSEEFMLEPEQSTDAIIVHHPEAKYFNIK